MNPSGIRPIMSFLASYLGIGNAINRPVYIHVRVVVSLCPAT
jgi:hypothetical protein